MSAPPRWRLVRDDADAPSSKLGCGASLPLPATASAPPLLLGRFALFAGDGEDGALTMSKALAEVDSGRRVRVTGSTPVFISATCGPRAPLRKGEEKALAPGDALLLQWGPPAAPRFVRLRLEEAEADSEAAPALAQPADPCAAAGAKRAASQGDAITQPEAKRARPETAEHGAGASPSAPASAPLLLSCCVCLSDDFPATDGAACASGHFTCDGCFEAHAASFAGSEMQLIEARRGQLHCPLHTGAKGGCTAPPFSMEELKLRSAATLESCMAARVALAKKETTDAGKAAAAARDAAEAHLEPEDKALLRAREAVDKLLCEACPGCDTAFADFSGCYALKCNHCPIGFCALCLAICGDDAHAHIGTPGLCPFHVSGGIEGTPEQLDWARRTRRAWGLWQLLDDARAPFALPAGRALRQRLLDSVRKNVEDHDVLGKPIGHFMTEANRPRSLRTLAQENRSAALAGAPGGGQLVVDPDGHDPFAAVRLFAAAIAADRNVMRPPVPPRPEPPKPLPAVFCWVVTKAKGEACKRCQGPLAQGAAALLHETYEPIFVPDLITGQQMATAHNKTTKEFYHLRCYKKAQPDGKAPERFYEALRSRKLNEWPGEAQSELFRLFPEPAQNKGRHAAAAEARAAAAAGGAAGAAAGDDDDLAGGSSGDEEEEEEPAPEPKPKAYYAGRCGGVVAAAADDAAGGGSSDDDTADDLLEAPAPAARGGCCGAAPASRGAGCRSAPPPPAEEDEVIILD